MKYRYLKVPSDGVSTFGQWQRGPVVFLLLMVIGYMGQSEAYANASKPVSELAKPGFSEPIRLYKLLNHAYMHNPSIRQAKESWRVTVESYRIKTGFPEPQLMMTWFPEPIETRLGPQDWNVQISQKIPFPGKLTRAGELVEADALLGRLKLDKAVKETSLAVKESFYELWYIRQAKIITLHGSRLLDHIRKVGETAHAENRATLTDIVKAQSQAGQLRYDILLLEELEETEIANLNGLLNRPPESVIGTLATPILEPFAMNVNAIYQIAEDNNEAIQMAGVIIQKSETEASLARLQRFPDLKVGLFYANIGEPDMPTPPPDAGRDTIGLQLGASIPLWFGKNNSRVEKALASRSRAEAEKQTHINNIHTQIRTLYFKVKNAQRIVTLYEKDLVPQAARSMELAEVWYQEGEASFTDFIEAQSIWYNFQLALARAHADYGINVARLERIAGKGLTEEVIPSMSPTQKEK